MYLNLVVIFEMSTSKNTYKSTRILDERCYRDFLYFVGEIDESITEYLSKLLASH